MTWAGDFAEAGIATGIATYFGAILGGFATVTAPRLAAFTSSRGRLPRFQEAISTLSSPPSSCVCGRHLGFLEKAPLLGYLVTRGKCSSCRSNVPGIYPMTEILGLACFLLFALPGILLVAQGRSDLMAFLGFVAAPGVIAGFGVLASPYSRQAAGIPILGAVVVVHIHIFHAGHLFEAATSLSRHGTDASIPALLLLPIPLALIGSVLGAQFLRRRHEIKANTSNRDTGHGRHSS